MAEHLRMRKASESSNGAIAANYGPDGLSTQGLSPFTNKERRAARRQLRAFHQPCFQDLHLIPA